MATALRLQYVIVIIISVSLYPKFSHGFCDEFHESPYRGVKIVTHGEPCPTPQHLPIRIEEPARPVEEFVPEKLYRPLKLSYETLNPPPQPQYLHEKYPISIEMPKVPAPEVTTYVTLPVKSYEYDIQIPPPPTKRISASYNLDFQTLPPNPAANSDNKEPRKYLTGLTSRIDRILIPACEESSCNCNKIYEA